MKAAHNYFRNELSSYFMWSDHGRELCWCDGTTIAFHEEITAVMDRLADETLPDFSSLALGLAALRTSWCEISDRITNAVTSLKASQDPGRHEAEDAREEEILAVWPDSRRKLTLLTIYVEARSLSTLQRAELLAQVFCYCSSNYGIATQDELAEACRAGLPEETVGPRDHDNELLSLLLPRSIKGSLHVNASRDVVKTANVRMLRLIRTANRIAARLPFETAAELNQLLTTGIVETVEAPDEQLLDQRAQTRRLLEQLSDDNELGGFARLARQLIAAVALPRTLSEPDELQIGGVSDISNRGNLDQLLLSELAHDDLTLSVRLALNEALYLRRESPPSPVARTRAVLIDMSLPMWGIPRLYAAAMALALHASTDKQTRIDCYRSTVDGVAPSMLTTRAGLTEQLAVLEPTEHPGGALASFVEMMGEESGAAEPVIITTSDVLANESFRQALHRASDGDFWLIVVERDGQLEVRQRTRHGTSVRKKLKLPLSEILSPKTAEKVQNKAVSETLPAIFHLKYFPLLLSHETRVGRVWNWADTAIALTADGRLMHWKEKGYGAKQLASGFAKNGIKDVFLVARKNSVLKLLICPMNGPKGLLVIIHNSLLSPPEATSGEQPSVDRVVQVTAADYQMDRVTDTCLTDSALLVFGKNAQGSTVCSAIDADTGEHLGKRTLDASWIFRLRRCLFTAENGFCVLTWEGGLSKWMFQRLPEAYQGKVKTTETSPGEYVSLSQSGELIDPLQPHRFDAIKQQLSMMRVSLYKFRDISVDGRFVVIGSHDDKQTIVDLENASLVSAESLEAIEYESVRKLIRTRVSHYRFSWIGTDRDRIILKNAAGQQYEIAMGRHDRLIRLKDCESLVSSQFVEFQAMQAESVVAGALVSAIPQKPAIASDQFHAVLTDAGKDIISVIRVMQAVSRLGIKEAKALVEDIPKLLKENTTRHEAEAIATAIKVAGGRCEIRTYEIPALESDISAVNVGYTLHAAEWPNGSTAWLDSRGLLHLKSANRAHPEITLILRDGTVSGWLSTGDVFGDNYYFGKFSESQVPASLLRRITAEAAWNVAVHPFIESVPWNFLSTFDTSQTGNTAYPEY